MCLLLSIVISADNGRQKLNKDFKVLTRPSNSPDLNTFTQLRDMLDIQNKSMETVLQFTGPIGYAANVLVPDTTVCFQR